MPLSEILAFTHNPGKVRELRALMPRGLSVLTPGDLPGGLADVEETGSTFAENALIKAAAGAQASSLPTLADDSGLSVDALGGRPGVRSARFAVGAGRVAPGAPREENTRANNALLLELLKDVPDAGRGARFECCLCLVLHPDLLSPEPPPPPKGLRALKDAGPDAPAGWMLVEARGTVEGRILREPRGEGGFGYDPLFESLELGASFGESAPEEKAKVSHRARALALLASYLRDAGAL
jgi:XTP/dITP diphosphohydrolase